MLRFREVHLQALEDERFANELADIVAAARRDGPGTESWTRLAAKFAETPEELELLTPPINTARGAVDTTTLTTLLMASNPTGGTTTGITTTTTSRLCSLPGACHKTGPSPKAKKKGTKKRK